MFRNQRGGITIIIAAILIIVLLGSGIYYFVNREAKNEATTSTTANTDANQSALQAPKKACDIFTQEVVKSVITGTLNADNTPSADSANGDVEVTNCNYSNMADRPSELVSVGMLARGAKTESGKDTNKFGFNSNKTRDYGNTEGVDVSASTPVEELKIAGFDAFYDPDLKQVNVLAKDNQYWLIFSGSKVEKDKLIALAEQTLKNL